MGSYEGAVAVVTGAGSGIGYALCRRLCRAGAVVYAADLNDVGLKELAREVSGPLDVAVLDVRDEAGVQALVHRVVAEQGRLDFVFNNAGIVMGGDFEATGLEDWRRILDVNLWGVIHGTRHAYEVMRRQGHGHIVNTASSAGVMPVGRSAAYAATKHAVVGLSTSLRAEARRHGVRVSVLAPGLVDTGIFDNAVNVGGYSYRRAVDRLSMRKISPDEAAEHILTGVARNKAVIVFPLANRLVVDAYRLLPGFVGRFTSSLT